MIKYTLILLLMVALSGFLFCPKMALSQEQDEVKKLRAKLVSYMPHDMQRLVRDIRKLDYKDRDARLTRYGYDFMESLDDEKKRGVRLRGGVSRLSRSAAPSIELVISW